MDPTDARILATLIRARALLAEANALDQDRPYHVARGYLSDAQNALSRAIRGFEMRQAESTD
jgi:hypothetical protein